MSPTIESQILDMVRDIQGDVSEIKGRVIAIESVQSKREAICKLLHEAVDSKISELEDAKDNTGIHDRQRMEAELERYRQSSTHWSRYLIGVVGTLFTTGVGALIAYALTHR